MDKAIYLDYDLLIEGSEEGYRARVLNSPAGQATAHFDLPFLEQDMRALEALQVETVKAFGKHLFEAVFDDQVQSSLHRSLDEANRQGAGLRIRLRLTDVPELISLPWEYLYDPVHDHFLVLSTETPLVRYLDLPEPIHPLAVKLPLRMLVMISSPSDHTSLDAEREWLALNKAVGELEQRGMFALERLETASLPALQRQLRQGEYHVFHFIGHGSFDERTQDGTLILEDEGGRGHPVSGQDLGMLLHDHRPLRLAFLNACEGARASQSDPFAGVAQSLVQRGIPAVVAMQSTISNATAIALVHEFYSALVEGYPVDADLAEARKAVFVLGSNVEWGTPVLYMRAPDGHIFDIERGRPSPPKQVGEGLRALMELMRSPKVQAAVVTFRIDFKATCEQISILGGYKHLHDLLHTMQFHCYHPIAQEARRFPGDDITVDNLMDYELTFQGLVNELRETTERASLATLETSWIKDLDQSRQEIHTALDNLDPKPLKKAIWRINRVLAIQPSQINTRLNAAARTLRLPALLEALTSVRDHLTHVDIDREKVRQFKVGVDALTELSQHLTALVSEHDRWQVVDLELRRIESAMRQDTMELEMSWPGLKAMLEPLYSSSDDEWATSLAADATALDDAMAGENSAKIRRHFRRCRRQVGDRFYRVDVDLKELCEELHKIGEPLASVMDIIG